MAPPNFPFTIVAGGRSPLCAALVHASRIRLSARLIVAPVPRRLQRRQQRRLLTIERGPDQDVTLLVIERKRHRHRCLVKTR